VSEMGAAPLYLAIILMQANAYSCVRAMLRLSGTMIVGFKLCKSQPDPFFSQPNGLEKNRVADQLDLFMVTTVHAN